jgi:hypothetical protein
VLIKTVDDPEQDRSETLPEIKLNLSPGVFPEKAGYIVVVFQMTRTKGVAETIK